jgi:hypothetical protein
MPRFYFHLRDDLDAPDDEGLDLPNLDAAREHAADNARFTLAQLALEQGKINFEHCIDIEDEQGCVLQTVRFRDVVEVEGLGRRHSPRPSSI